MTTLPPLEMRFTVDGTVPAKHFALVRHRYLGMVFVINPADVYPFIKMAEGLGAKPVDVSLNLPKESEYPE